MSPPVDRRLLRTVPALRRHLGVLAALQALAAGLTVAQAMILADTVVHVAAGAASTGALTGRFVALLAVMGARAAVTGVQEWRSARASTRVRADLRRATLDAAVRLGPAWSQRQPPGRLAGAIGPGVDGLDGYVTRALPALVGAVVTPPVVLAAIGWTDWSSGLILLVLLPLVPLFMVLIGITTRRRVEQQYTTLERLSGHFLDLVRGLPTLRIYGREADQARTLRAATERLRRHTLAALRVALLSGLVLDLAAALSIAVVAVDVGLRLDAGHTGFLTALTVLLLAPELYAPLRALGAQHHATQEGAAAAGAALDIVDEAATTPSTEPVAASTTLRGGIVVDGLRVGHPGRERAALSLPGLRITAGQVVVLTGPSGAGKSTLLAALLGFVPVEPGTVRFTTADGEVVLTPADAAALRENLAWLPQRPATTGATVADEVRLGDPTASAEQVASACGRCRTPHPATRLGEDGAAVSAGQRRRIALARALLRAESVCARGGVPVVLLDEPSEELDERTERVVAAVIDGMRGRATVLVATHSEALARLADLRVVLADGCAVRVGTQRPEPAADPGPAHDAFLPRLTLPPAEPVGRAHAGVRLIGTARAAGAGRHLALAGALAVASALAGLGLTACSMWLIARAAAHPNVQDLAVAVVGVRTFAIGRAVLRYGERLAAHDGALRMLVEVRARVFAALAPVPLTTLGRYGRGDLLRRFVGDVDGAQEALVRGAIPAVGAAAAAGGAVTLAAVLSPAAGLALAAGVLVAAVAVPLAARLAAGPASKLVELAGRRDRLAVAVADGLPELVAYGAAHRALDGVSGLDAAYDRTARRPAAAAAAGVVAAGSTFALTLVAVLAAAATAVTGGLPASDVAVLTACVLVAFDATGSLPAAAVAWARCRAGLRRVAELLACAPAVPEPRRPASGLHGPTGLRARGLAVAPAPDAPTVLDGIALDIPAGGSVAVAGPSGCGKTTLLATVLRQARARAGRLEITPGGRPVELATVAAADLPPLVAGSLQGDHVFDSTLRDNLRVVRPAATDADLDVVAERVGLRQFVHALPAGWDTPAGPDGCTLSGGQRQRLLLARALLADPQVLVLDEPTAHLDPDTERLVLDGLLDPRADRTVVLTSHRAAALEHAGTALVVDGRALRSAHDDRRVGHG